MNWIAEYMPMDNEFFAGGLMLSMVVAVWQMARGIPTRVWPFIQRRVIFTVTVDTAFTEASLTTIGVWLAANGYRNKVGQVYYDQWNGTFCPGNLVMWIRYDGHRLLIRHNHEGESTQNGTKTRKTVSFTGLRRSKSAVMKLVKEIQDTPIEKREGRTQVVTRGMRHDVETWVASRISESICLPDRKYELLLEDIRRFLSSEDRYQSLGIPYHRAWLLQGPPGTGKTSVVQALATDLKRGITVISGLSSFSSSGFLRELNKATSDGHIVLIEDVDATGTDATKAEPETDKSSSLLEDPMSLADMLNALDGISTPSGLMLFMTTNYPERINERLLRPGRVDYVLPFDYLTRETAMRMSFRFFPGDDQLADEFGDLVEKDDTTPANLQSKLLLLLSQRETVETL